MVATNFLGRICALFRPTKPFSDHLSDSTSSASSVFKSCEKPTQHPAVRQLHQEQQNLKATLYQSFLNARAQSEAQPNSKYPIAKAATTTNDSGEKVTPELTVPRGMSPVEAATTTDSLSTPKQLVNILIDEQQTPLPNQYSSVKISAISWRGRLQHKSSRGFALVKNVLRHRRPEPEQPPKAIAKNSIEAQIRTVSDGEDSTASSKNGNPSSSTGAIVSSLPRRVSDKTIRSDTSQLSDATVCHWPSRRASSPIATVARDTPTQYTEATPPTGGPPDSATAKQLRAVVVSPRTSSDSSMLPGFRAFSGISTRISESSDYFPPAVCSLPNYMLHQRLFSDMGIQVRHTRAFNDYNELARAHELYALIPPEHDPINDQKITPPRQSKRKAFIYKVRSMRSSFRLIGTTQRPTTLRRVKTFTGLSARFYAMDSLKGKSLETLSRLGGYSILAFPGDFVPAVMRLPSCLVSMINYLKTHASKSRNVFFKPGDTMVASRVYDHFADQVLSVEREKDIVDSTIRKCRFPSEAMGFGSEEESFMCGRFHVLPVAWAFKHILAGIPGRILGSARLYLTLVDISYRHFADEPSPPMCGLYGAMPAISHTRVRAISLAILALTSDMQLDLICAVFGLCALLDYETSQVDNFYYPNNSGPVIGRTGLLTRERMIQAFAPLLADATSAVGEEDFESDAFYVMRMMMDNWRAVSRQLHDFDV